MKIPRFLPAAVLTALAACLLTTPARAVIIGEESFSYPDGPIAGKNGGNLWNWRNRAPAARTTGGASDWDNVTGAPAVSAGRLITADSAVTREFNGPGEGTSVDIDRDDGLGAISKFASGDISFQEKVVYFRVTFTTGATLPTSVGLSAQDFGTEKVFFGKPGSKTNFAVSSVSGGVQAGGPNLLINTTYTLVGKLDYLTGNARLFLNPDFNAAEPATPAITSTFDTGAWTSALRLASSGPAAVIWDDLRVATTWEDLVPMVVTTTADEDDGSPSPTAGAGTSLREAVKYVREEAVITFAPGLSGQTIALTHEDGDIAFPVSCTIDATSLPGGLTLDGNNSTRQFFIGAGRSVTLRGLTFTRGKFINVDNIGEGGSIYNVGSLQLDRCLFRGNSANIGGAVSSHGIFDFGTRKETVVASLRAQDCVFVENSGNAGGLSLEFSSAELVRCTVAGNTGSGLGISNISADVILTRCTVSGNLGAGVQMNSGVLYLTHCTVSSNEGSGISYRSTCTVDLTSSIVAGNTVSGLANQNNQGVLRTTGVNLTDNSTDLKLAPLGNYGGLTPTRALLSGSPARDAATGSTITTDQRGFPIFGTPDIGAFEAQFSPIANVSTYVNAPTAALPFSVGQAGALTVSSTNLTLVPVANIVLGGSGANRTVTVSPAAGQTGTAVIRLTDSGSGEYVEFTLTVNPLLVTTATDEDNNSLDPAVGSGVSLREAVKLAPDGGLITFAPALAGKTIVLTHADGDLEISRALTIDATALAGGLTLDGNNTSRHFSVPGGKSLTLRGFTLTRGNADDTQGGSILNSGALTLERCVFRGNRGGLGAAVCSVVGFTASDCTFTDNLAGEGGALWAGTGMGHDVPGTLALTRCTISGNTATSRCGALWIQGDVSMDHCTISGNQALGSDPWGNLMVSRSLNLRHCTITRNTSNGATGGIVRASLTLESSIVAGNTGAGGIPADIYFRRPTFIGVNLIGSNATSEEDIPAGPFVGTAAAPLDPKLSPLGYFGGTQLTHYPLVGSPAIDSGGATDPGGTDARGFPRFTDGNAAGGAQLDLGAVEAGPLLLVTQGGDDASGANLRNTLALAATFNVPGVHLGFAPALSGAVIPLDRGELSLPAGKMIFLDASDLAAPVTLSGKNATRVLTTVAGSTTALHSFKLLNGQVPEAGNNGGHGGGILNAGELSLFHSTIADCRAGAGRSTDIGFDGGHGGGIYSTGPLLLHGCTLSGNAAGNGGNGGANGISGPGGAGGHGGGIHSTGPLRLTACTLSGNTTGSGGNGVGPGRAAGNGGNGGGIWKNDSVSWQIDACTLAGNRCAEGGTSSLDAGNRGLGGGVSGGRLTLRRSLIAGNIGQSAGPDVNVTALLTPEKNLLGTAPSVTATGEAPLIAADAKLAPLGDRGGRTPTMALLPGSPARDAATGSPGFPDQRGLAAFGTPDFGAYEAQLGPIPDASTAINTATAPVAFSVGQVGPLSVLASSNAALAPLANIVLGGNGASRTVTVTPAANQNGSSVIQIQDSLSGEISAFTLTVTGTPVTDFTVTTGADSGPGSLREKLAAAASVPGADTVTFAPDFSATGHVNLTTELLITDTAPVTIDASALPHGATLNGGDACRLLRLDPGADVTLRRLVLTGGNAVGGGTPANYGGAVHSQGRLILLDCTVAANTGSVGGAFYNANPGTLTLERCAVYGNKAGHIGGVMQQESQQPVTATYCTFANNQAGTEAGAISAPFGRPVRLVHCTVSANTVTAATGKGGGLTGTGLTLSDSIVAGNTAADTPDITPGFTAEGTNLTGSATDPRLAALADNGGPTWTMALLAGSPALNAATGTPAPVTDQRGFPMTGQPDIGAFEAGETPEDDYTTFINAALPGTATPAQRAPDYDYDGDGQTNQAEWITGTQPADPGSVYQPELIPTLNSFIVNYATVPGRTYTLQQSDTLAPGSWSNALPAGLTTTGDGETHTWNFSRPGPEIPRRFYRVLVTR